MINLKIIEDPSTDTMDCAAFLGGYPGIKIVARTENQDEGLRLAAQCQPDVSGYRHKVGIPYHLEAAIDKFVSAKTWIPPKVASIIFGELHMIN